MWSSLDVEKTYLEREQQKFDFDTSQYSLDGNT